MKIDHRRAVTALFIVVALGTSSGAYATDVMYARLNGAAVYDATTNLTWISNGDLALTDTFGVSGIYYGSMTWDTAQSWIGAMNAANYLGFNNWQLPTTLQPDPTCSTQLSGGVSDGSDCTGSQIGNLFYNALGGVDSQDIATTHNANYNLFSNLQCIFDTCQNYWSGTEYAPDPTNQAWVSDLSSGYDQFFTVKSFNAGALVVRPGDVAAVPVPPAVWLFGSGMVGLLGVIRKRKAAY